MNTYLFFIISLFFILPISSFVQEEETGKDIKKHPIVTVDAEEFVNELAYTFLQAIQDGNQNQMRELLADNVIYNCYGYERHQERDSVVYFINCSNFGYTNSDKDEDDIGEDEDNVFIDVYRHGENEWKVNFTVFEKLDTPAGKKSKDCGLDVLMEFKIKKMTVLMNKKGLILSVNITG